MDNESSIITQVAVSMLPRLNTFACLPLIEQCGGIEGFFKETVPALEALLLSFNIRKDCFNRTAALEKAQKELSEMDKHGIHICSIEQPAYPCLLKQCEDAPLVLFYKGILNPDPNSINLAIVGTRHATPRCQAKVESILEEIHNMGHHLTVVSGLAYGIDASAHRGSLKCEMKTYAVLGHGLHMIYPAAHKNLAEKILEDGGALITEFPCCATVLPSNFLQRNRIVAGMSQATLIAESAEKGGAMATARIALSYNRDVMAIPGRTDDKWSAGCNRLIKENVAALVENGTDVARILGLSCEKKHYGQTVLNLFDTEDNETVILKLLADKGGMNIDEMCIASRISTGELSALLLKLELEGRVTALPGKNYTLV